MSSALSQTNLSLNIRCYDTNLNPEHINKLGLTDDVLNRIGEVSTGFGQLYESEDGKHFIQIQPEMACVLPQTYKEAAYAKILKIVSGHKDVKNLKKVDVNFPMFCSLNYCILSVLLRQAWLQESEECKDLHPIMHPQRFTRLFQGRKLIELFDRCVPLHK
jgi:hypothetical protein